MRINGKATITFFALTLIAMLGISGSAFAQDSFPVGLSAETQYILNSFMFLVLGAFVMWMAAGFAMLESGLVRARNTASICLKNVALYAIAGIAFYMVGYNLMYVDLADHGLFGALEFFYNPSTEKRRQAGTTGHQQDPFRG